MKRFIVPVINAILIGFWGVGIAVALPGLALMGISARVGLWLTGESM